MAKIAPEDEYSLIASKELLQKFPIQEDNFIDSYDPIEPSIDIDTEILQNKVILRSYWYCKSQTVDIIIDIAYLKKMVLIPILILLDKLN